MTLTQGLLQGALNDAFRVIVPHQKDRIPMTRHVAWIPLLCYAPFVFLCYLARRPDTYLIRLLMLPSVITAILVAAYKFTWTQPELNVYNWGQCAFAAVAIAKALEYALHPEGMLKVGESRPGIPKGKHRPPTNGVPTSNGYLNHANAWWYDALDLACSMRGIGWKFGRGVHIPAPRRPLSPLPLFLRSTLTSFLTNYLLLDLLESLIKLFPGVGSPLGGTIFYPSLSPLPRYLTSTTIHLLTGAALLAGFGMVYDLLTLLSVTLLHSSPSAWPPVLDGPWSAESMHDFWARRWHQLLRQTFLVFGGYPGRALAGNVGMLCGTFLASGLFHECAMYAMNRGFDHSATLFFAAQGPVLLFERVWRRVSGRRIGGWAGRGWVYFIMFVAAQPMVNAWHRRGLGGGMVIPPCLSPFRTFVLPFLHRAVDAIQGNHRLQV